jgi:hypothetical protein
MKEDRNEDEQLETFGSKSNKIMSKKEIKDEAMESQFEAAEYDY